MNIKKYANGIIAGASGLLLASTIILVSNNSTKEPATYKVSIENLRNLQSQLAEARIELEELKIDYLLGEMAMSTSGKPENTTPDITKLTQPESKSEMTSLQLKKRT